MSTTIASYIATRLEELNCKHIFGIPGTSCSGFFDMIDKRPGFEAIVTSNELEAGYAADGYARMAGFGAAVVAYGVGTLSMINAVAGSMVEKVPLLVLNGGPSKSALEAEQQYGVLFSHSTGRPQTDYRLFREVCVGAHIMDMDQDIPAQIDAILIAALANLGPVYLELPEDQWTLEIPSPTGRLSLPKKPEKPSKSMQSYLERAMRKAERASKPVFLLGVEIVRQGFRDQVLEMLEATGYPFATTVLSKSYILESHPQFRGTYDTDLVVKPVRHLLENECDCLIGLGCVYGVDLLTLISKQYDSMINLSFGSGQIEGDPYPDLSLETFIERFRPKQAVEMAGAKARMAPYAASYSARRVSWVPADILLEEGLTHEKLFDSVDTFLNGTEQHFVTVLDTCLGSFPGADLHIPTENAYAANPVWLSIGHGTPAANGVYLSTGARPLIITGDGGFQMVVQAVSTMVRYQIPAVLIIIDNGAYAIEQFLIDSCYFVEEGHEILPYVGLNPWNYEAMPELFGKAVGVKVNTNEEFRQQLVRAEAVTDRPFIISAQVKSTDLPPESRPWAEEHCPN